MTVDLSNYANEVGGSAKEAAFIAGAPPLPQSSPPFVLPDLSDLHVSLS